MNAQTEIAALSLLALTACAHQGATTDVVGPRSSRVDIYKPWPGADKLYVPVDLGDGTPRMMLLDSGAGVTLLTPDVADALGLSLSPQVSEYMQVSGVLEARTAVLPKLTIGRQTLANVQVAVPVAPVHDRAGGVAIAGLLGANVLSRFQIVVDYPANRLELHHAGTQPPPEGAAPLYFDGQHAMTGIVLVGQRDGVTAKQQLLVDIDTGSRGLWLFGELSDDLASLASEGLEPVVGVSSAEDMPMSALLRTTRRIPVIQVHAGGTIIDRKLDATWTSFDQPALGLTTPSPGLLGHALLDGYRAVLDYQAQRFALLPPRSTRPEHDINQWQLRRLRHSHDADRRLRMAELQSWMGDLDQARHSLERHHARHPDDDRGTVMLARMWRLNGDADAALDLLSKLDGAALAKQGELDAVVNSMWLRGQSDQALALAQQAVAALPDSQEAWVSMADAGRAAGKLPAARQALLRANTLAEAPDGDLLRRAWIATEEGDVFGALTHLRRRLEMQPSGMITPWFYAPLAVENNQIPLLLEDLDRTRARLHPGEGGLDFLAAAYQRAGRTKLAHTLV
ncbi:MAG: hypothetical protein GXP62_06665, partial [Oligoflexia bacterium]|nr:hypothetical protein [Oligoflexia bacterium]